MKPSVVSDALALVAPAETAFSSRWRMSTLARLDHDLHEALSEQRWLFDSALVTGSDHDVKTHSEALVRGYRAACARMEAPLQPDDAYLVGQDQNSFIRVIIGDHKQSASRAQALDGRQVYFLTPDEVAAMFAAFTALRSVKDVFPDAELLNMTSLKAKSEGIAA